MASLRVSQTTSPAESQCLFELTRILFVFCSMEYGGAEKQGLLLAQHLKSLGCDVHAWSCLQGTGGSQLLVEKCGHLQIPLSVHRFLWPCRKSSFVRDIARFGYALRKLAPHVVLPYNDSPNIACGLTWRWSGAKVCVWGQRNTHGLNGDFVERVAFRQSSAIICNAPHEVDHLRNYMGHIQKPLFVVPNGVSLEPPQANRTEWRNRIRIPGETVLVTMVANFRECKDHETLLRAWHQVMGQFSESRLLPHLALAGSFQDSHQHVVDLRRELNLETSVTLLPQTNDVSGLLAASDVGVLTSLHEGLPNATIEYMSAGLPIVASDIAGNRTVLGPDAAGFLFRPKDTHALARLLTHVIADPELRKSAGVVNRIRAEEAFSVSTMSTNMTRIIAQLLVDFHR